MQSALVAYRENANSTGWTTAAAEQKRSDDPRSSFDWKAVAHWAAYWPAC